MMNIIERTKARWGEKLVRTQLNSVRRTAEVCNIHKADSIGILFNATHQVSFEIIKELVKNLTTKTNTIDVLGYVDTKQLIDHYLYRKGFDFFTRKQLNWFYKPINSNVDEFVKKPFDILLDLSLDQPFPIRYILAYSEAKFKAGKYTEGAEYLDFMIDISKENETMNALKKELENDSIKHVSKNEDIEIMIDKRAQTEIQLNFLINQLLHYLSLLKN
jgi:hypothetical protein